MRDLRVVGVNADGTHVVCQDTETNERYQIPADERLRAAARGDISRLGQIEIEMESSLRPREIQSRIRAGATVAEVAAAAGVPPERIERFAHPVLLERTRATELAALAHPIRADGPSEYTLAEVVADGLTAHGRNPQDAEWDAWKVEDGFWVVQIGWHVGRTDHYAHWRFHLGSHGGTAEPLDELADELTHPETIRPQRRLTSVAAPDLTPIREITDDGKEEVTFDADSLIGAQRARVDHPRRDRRDANPVDPSDHDGYGTGAFDFGDEDTQPVEVEAIEVEAVETVDAEVIDVEEPAALPGPVADTARTPEPTPVTPRHATPDAWTTPGEPVPDKPTRDEPAPEPAAADRDDERGESPAADGDDADNEKVIPTPTAPRRRKSGKPAVPAWEDVLLGVRSNPNS